MVYLQYIFLHLLDSIFAYMYHKNQTNEGKYTVPVSIS